MERRMNETIVSVIVPIYNGSMYVDFLVSMIKRYIQAANKEMEYTEESSCMELILIDDGSVDDTYEKCIKYAKLYPWIHFIHSENCGVSHARNLGLNAACGKWIQFLDVDDVIETEMFRAFIDADADLAVCGCKRVHESQAPVLCGPKADVLLQDEALRRFYDHISMEDRYWLLDYCWNKWYKKAIIDEYNIRFDESMSLGEDFVFNTQYMRWIRSAALRKTCYYQYLVGNAGLVSRFQEKPWIGRMKQYQAQKALYQSMDLWANNEAWISIQYGQIAFGDLRMINSPRCVYSISEKVKFIRTVMDTPLYDWILSYLKERDSKIFQVYANAWGRKNVPLLLSFIYTEKGKLLLENLRCRYREQKDLKIKTKRIGVIEENKKNYTQRGVTILSQNCVGGVFYHDMEQEFLSPTINLFFEAADFVKFVNQLQYYLSLELKMSLEREYPIGVLDDIKVHFYHYTTADEAKEAWDRRKKRVNYSKIMVLSTDRDGFDHKVFDQWCEIPYAKVLFTANKDYAGHPDVLYYPEFEKNGCVTNDLIEKRMFYREGKVMDKIHQI